MKRYFIAAILVCQALADSTSLRLYWTDKDNGLIQSADPDGGNRVTLLSGLGDVRGIGVDVSQDKMFWAAREPSGAIWWANCDGSEKEVFIGSLNDPADLVLDLENRLIYWAEEGLGQIRRADLDGSRTVESVVIGLSRPYYLALDGGFVYWSYFNSSVIHRAPVEGGEISPVISGQQRVRDIEIFDGVIYWCDRNSSQLRSRALDGVGGGTILFSGGILDRPHGLVLDPMTDTMYWTDTETQLIGSSSMDGNGPTLKLEFDDEEPAPDGPWAIDLVRPVPLGEPLDAWRADHFSGEDLGDPLKEATVWGGNADPDGDGVPNVMEYARGTDPNSPAVSPGTISFESGEKVRITFRMRADDPELNFVLEATEDLSSNNWNSDAFVEVGERVPDPIDGAYELITVEAEAGTRAFARLRVSR